MQEISEMNTTSPYVKKVGPMFKVALLFASPLVVEQYEMGKTVLKDKVYDQIDFNREFKWTNDNTFNEKIRY